MKKTLLKSLLLSTSLLTLGSTILPTGMVFASEQNITENSSYSSNDNVGVSIQKDENGDLMVVKMETKARANVARWGAWQYTHIALSTGVTAGAINTAYSKGIGSVLGIFGLPGWAIGNLLTAAGWTNYGNSPGNAVARLWDKNHNGWVGFYKRTGYDGAGRAVATAYKTE